MQPARRNDRASRSDLQQIAEFVRAHPDACRHFVDLPYRLASPAAQAAENRRLWRAADGAVRAFAITQLPFWTLDYALLPAAGDELDEALEREVLAWGIARWREIAGMHDRRWLFVDCPDDQPERVPLLEELGFARHRWQQYHLRQPLGAAPLESPLPAGFAIRPLAGEGEIEAYVALHRTAFGSENMTCEWRRQTLAMSDYHSELDLVAVAPDGQLAGFGICWLADVGGYLEGQIEPLGIHPTFQGQGLGRALVQAGLSRLFAAGARVAHIEVDGDNDGARALYESAGFRIARTISKFGRELPEDPSDTEHLGGN